MPEQSFDAALRALRKGDIQPVYYLTGREDLLKNELVRTISGALLDPSLRDFNLDQRTATSLDPEQLFTLLNTLPMMADRRVVILRDVEGWQKKSRGRAELLRYLEKPSRDTVLILVQGSGDPDPDAELAKRAVTVSCAPLPPERALKWLQHRAGREGLTIPDDAAGHLLHVTGGDLATLEAEVAKLAALPPGTDITRDLVGSIVGVRHGETIYDWRDAVFDGDTPRALALLGPVLDQSGISGVKLVTLIGTTLSGVAIARAHLDKGQRGGALERAVFGSLLKTRPFGLPEWKPEAARWSRWAERWPQARLSDALRSALSADTALKSTTLSDEHATIVELVLRLRGGGGGTAGRLVARAGGALARVLLLASALAAPSALSAQVDSPLAAALALAQEGRIDSARASLKRLETSTAPTDSIFPGILYSSALVAPDATEARRQLQRVVVEYPVSSWAGESMIRLAQLDYANGDPATAARQLEKFRTDHASSPLFPIAAVWGARAAFDVTDVGAACQWVADGLGRNPNETARSELIALSKKCSTPTAGPTAGPTDSIKPSAPNPEPPSRPAQPPPPAVQAPSGPGLYRVQIAAAATEGAATQMLGRARTAGFDGVIEHEGAYYKVRLGSYATRAEAVAAMQQVKAKLGGAPFLVNP